VVGVINQSYGKNNIFTEDYRRVDRNTHILLVHFKGCYWAREDGVDSEVTSYRKNIIRY